MNFDIYAFADYSGSKSDSQQRKHIVLAVSTNTKRIPAKIKNTTRRELRQKIEIILKKATVEEKRVIFGFDFSYSFPKGFFEIITGKKWENWRQLPDLIKNGDSDLPPLHPNPRKWAEKVNQLIADKLKLPQGPFWGANFVQLKKPLFPFGRALFEEKRLVEKRRKNMKPIFQLGGAGAVGLQSLWGIYHLSQLISFCRSEDIPLFCWPFDGWELPKYGHVLTEVYPALYNRSKKTDARDAIACACWFAKQDTQGSFEKCFQTDLNSTEKEIARLEGWIVGI